MKFITRVRMPDGKISDKSREVPWKTDGVTGLPWFTTIHGEMAGRALAQDLHVVDLHLVGLSTIMDARGATALASVLREIARGATGLLDDRDLLSRQTGDRLLLVTARPAAEVPLLVQDLVDRIAAVGVPVDGVPIPQVHVGVAHLQRASDYAEAVARLDAAILSAEFAAGPAPSPRSAGPTAGETAIAGSRRKRAALASLRLDLSGLVATATVALTFERRRAVARSVGRNAEGRRLFLIAEATTRAVTDLLPTGYGAVIHDVQLLRSGVPEQERGVLASVLFLSPDSEQYLFGVAPAGDDPRMAAARASLGALNRRIEPLLATSEA